MRSCFSRIMPSSPRCAQKRPSCGSERSLGMRSFATAAMALYPPRRSNKVFVASLIVSSSKLVVRQFALSKFFQRIHQIRNLRPLIQGSKVNLRRNKSEPRMAEMGHERPGRAGSGSGHVRFSNRPFRVKHFQTIRRCSVDVASLIGRSGSSTFRLSAAAVSMSLTGSRFSSESAPRPFHYGIRG